jgi:hypothetical protein
MMELFDSFRREGEELGSDMTDSGSSLEAGTYKTPVPETKIAAANEPKPADGISGLCKYSLVSDVGLNGD